MAQVITERSYYSYYPSFISARVINWVIGIIEVMLGVRFILTFLGAGASPFVAWVYDVTAALVGPFAGAFPSFSLGPYVIDTSTIFAMIGWAFIGWLLVQILAFVFRAVEGTPTY